MTSQGNTDMTQRDYMRKLYLQHNGEKAKIVSDYAQAERDGKVARNSNDRRFSPEEYASRLFYDGVHDGWIKN